MIGVHRLGAIVLSLLALCLCYSWSFLRGPSMILKLCTFEVFGALEFKFELEKSDGRDDFAFCNVLPMDIMWDKQRFQKKVKCV